MTNIGPGLVYGMVHLWGLFLVALPILAGSFLLDRWVRDYARSLVAAILAHAGLALGIALWTGTADLDLVWTFGTLGVLYVPWPLAIATTVVKLGRETSLETAARLAVLGWVLVLAGTFVLPFLDVNPLAVIEGTPALFGLAWLSGYVGLTAATGVLAGLCGIALPRVSGVDRYLGER